MDVLSTTAGSAQAVRDAAAASDAAVDSRLALERELDRLNAALGSHSMATAQHLNWTLLAQSFLLTSYLIVLVAGWSVPLPGKRWLLAAIAGYGALSLILGYVCQRGSRDRLAPLRHSRRLIEEALERVASRPTVFSRDRVLMARLGDWATRLMPVVILAGWAALSLYTLSLPIPSDVRASLEVRGDARSASTAASSSSPRARAAPRKAEEVPAAPTESTAAEGESGLAALFRRALNAPPSEAAEPIKP
jgi:hypothetical protein